MNNANHESRFSIQFAFLKRRQQAASSRPQFFQDLRRLALSVCLCLFLPGVAVRATTFGMIDLIPTAEYNELVYIYNNTGGSAWANNTNWLNPNAASWDGVQVTGVQYNTNHTAILAQGHVTTLTLVNNHLIGTIPANLDGLAKLQSLSLYNNDPDPIRTNATANNLTGSIPNSIGNLSALTYFNVDYDQITGSIPDSIGNLSQLTHFFVIGNQITGEIPASIANLTQLQYVYFSGNLMTGEVPYFQVAHGLDLESNCFDISPGSESISNIDLIKAGGATVNYSPQNDDCGSPPTVITAAASNVGSLSATLNGTVNPNGSATSVYFQYGTTTSYGNASPIQNLGDGADPVAFNANITDLASNILYHYQAVAFGAGVTNYGADTNFFPQLEAEPPSAA